LSASRAGRFISGERNPFSQWILGCVDIRAHPKPSEKIILPLPGIELKSLGHPFRNLVVVQSKLSMEKQKHNINKEVREEST
jgi:hypothetical protein